MKDQESLDGLRHSLAHLTAAAVRAVIPGARNTIGPAIENGFYQDFELPRPLSEDELPAIEAKMRELLPSWTSFERREVTPDEARAEFAWNPYKLEMIEELVADGQQLTFYTSGGFVDLCRGGHSAGISGYDPQAFALTKVAGAYWRGDEKKQMLTRVYGLAFATKAELDAHRAMLDEAAKRDHRKLGKELDLFVFSDLVGSGLPLWTPKGTLLRTLLDEFVWELRAPRGYERVEIPHVTKKDLYERSGHWDKFSDELFRIVTREGHEFAMKPMNCPHHIQIFARKPWSYRELPQRYANTTMVYRDEQSGELGGLSRVRAITQDDAHVFCRMSQAKEEALKVWDIIHAFYGAFGFQGTRVRLSMSDPAAPEKYLGQPAQWREAEEVLRQVAAERGTEVYEGVGEAAFYGPKLDFMVKDAIGREHQVATIQFDFNMPERFGLACTDESGGEERLVMIHAAIMGSIERFLVVLIEHVAGAFPLWLAPVQVRLLPVSDRFGDYAAEVAAALREAGIRAEVPDASETLGKRIRAAQNDKVPYTLVVGEKEVEARAVSVRDNRSGEQETVPLDAFLERTRAAIAARSL